MLYVLAVLPPHIYIYRQCGGDPYSYIILHIYYIRYFRYTIFFQTALSPVCVIRGSIVTVSYHIILRRCI